MIPKILTHSLLIHKYKKQRDLIKEFQVSNNFIKAPSLLL
uniref:Uncharacterized protein n=1 Tax=Manihot esculenta TaxID=3983 RepID=A0A2C9UJU7_MANES